MKKLVDQWDKAAKKYTQDQEQSDFVESNKRVVKARFQDMSGQKVLDLGCGYGYYTDYFQSIGADVIGVDGSVNMIDIARSRYKNCTFDICDITEGSVRPWTAWCIHSSNRYTNIAVPLMIWN